MSNLNCTSPNLVDGNQELDQQKQEEASPPPFTKTMEDLPPELLTKILEFLTLDAADQNVLLGYRLVNFQWKDIFDSLIEKKIVSGEFPTSPVMNIKGFKDKLQVRLPQTGFSADGNPFPFNSLHFTIAKNDPEHSNYPFLSLPAFATKFGENLTSLGLRNLSRFLKSSMATLLSSMPSLKRLHLKDVTSGDKNSFSTPPPLPFLTILDLVLTVNTWAMDQNYHNLYVWLFASYADQLVSLHLESTIPFPPLQTRHQYTYTDLSFKTRSLASTSESAFRNLKELKISNPSRNFLLLSETPALQHFSVVDVDSFYYRHEDENHESELLADIIIFIDRCASTLETLVLSYPWISMVTLEVFNKFLDRHRPLFLPASQIVARLKTLVVYYPYIDLFEMVLSELLVKFPALEELQLLLFQLNIFDNEFQIEDVGQLQIVNNEAVADVDHNIQLAEETVEALKERLPPLFQDMSGISNNVYVTRVALYRLNFENGVEEQAAVDQGPQLEAEIERLEHLKGAIRMQRAGIFRRLAALGINTEKVMVEQLLERGGYWNTCPRLRIVSVSNGKKKPVGDVCVIRRSDDA